MGHLLCVQSLPLSTSLRERRAQWHRDNLLRDCTVIRLPVVRHKRN